MKPNDVLNILRQQREQAMDALALVQAEIVELKRQLEEKKQEDKPDATEDN